MTYQCKHFKIEELVPRSVHKARGDKAWQLLDERALITLDMLREQFGPITVNDWVWGGSSENRGLRSHDSKVGAKYSQHKYGRAFDCIFKNVTSEEVRQYILDDPEAFPYLSSMELETLHLHFDVRNVEPIMTFKP